MIGDKQPIIADFSSMKKNTPCRFFGTKKGCPNGENCQFSHQKMKNRRCRFFNSPQGCPYSLNCTFTHEPLLLEKVKQSINKQNDEKSMKKQKLVQIQANYFCPVCFEKFEEWEATKTHFEESGHLGCHCTMCGKSFVVIHHRNVHEKESGHDVFRGVMVQEQSLKEIPKERIKKIINTVNDPPKLQIEHFYFGYEPKYDKQTITEDYVVKCLEYFLTNNVYKGLVKILGLKLLLTLEDSKQELKMKNEIEKLIQISLETNQDLQFIFQLIHLYKFSQDKVLKDLDSYKKEKIDLSVIESQLDNKLIDFEEVKPKESFTKSILESFDKEVLKNSKDIDQIKDKLTLMIQEKWKDVSLNIYGSALLGLLTKESDIDICIIIPDKYMLTPKHALLELEEHLKKHGVEDIHTILNTRVPLISFKMDGNKIDIVIDQEVNIHKTLLILNNMKIDSRVAPLLFSLKKWKKFISKKFITNESLLTKNGFLNLSYNKSRELTFYCLSLMMIFYLQIKGVLPNVQKEKIEKWVSECKEDVGELLLGFFKEFSFYDYENNIISVRMGKSLTREESELKNHSILVEDPLETDVNAARQISKRKLTIEMKRAMFYIFDNEVLWK